MQSLSAKNKGLFTQLSEAKRRQAEIECKVSVSVMLPFIDLFIVIIYCLFETASHYMALASLELAVWTKLASKSH